jgi:hypothetical protein
MAIFTKEPTTKTGTEVFTSNGKPTGMDILDFWKWNKSNLLEKKTRNELARFIVARALDNGSPVKEKFPSWELESSSGKRLSVRSDAFYENGKIKKNSQLKFSILGHMGDKNTPGFTGFQRRWSDVFIFSVLITKDPEMVDPLDLDQWNFYVVPTRVLDEKDRNSSHITLGALLGIDHTVCKFHELKKAIDSL